MSERCKDNILTVYLVAVAVTGLVALFVYNAPVWAIPLYLFTMALSLVIFRIDYAFCKFYLRRFSFWNTRGQKNAEPSLFLLFRTNICCWLLIAVDIFFVMFFIWAA